MKYIWLVTRPLRWRFSISQKHSLHLTLGSATFINFLPPPPPILTLIFLYIITCVLFWCESYNIVNFYQNPSSGLAWRSNKHPYNDMLTNFRIYNILMKLWRVIVGMHGVFCLYSVVGNRLRDLFIYSIYNSFVLIPLYDEILTSCWSTPWRYCLPNFQDNGKKYEVGTSNTSVRQM